LSKYRKFETNEFIKKLKKLTNRDITFLTKKLNTYVYPQLCKEPHFGKNIKKLAGYNPDTWRYRIGDFRLFYGIDEDEKIIFIFTVEPRKDAYK